MGLKQVTQAEPSSAHRKSPSPKPLRSPPPVGPVTKSVSAPMGEQPSPCVLELSALTSPGFASVVISFLLHPCFSSSHLLPSAHNHASLSWFSYVNNGSFASSTLSNSLQTESVQGFASPCIFLTALLSPTSSGPMASNSTNMRMILTFTGTALASFLDSTPLPFSRLDISVWMTNRISEGNY